MARPSKLSPDQWATIEKRLTLGETASALGREFGISEGAIRQKFPSIAAVSTKVREIAEMVVATRTSLAEMPPLHRQSALSLADELMEISSHLTSAAKYGSATAHRLSALAHCAVGKIDDADPLSSIEALKGVSGLTRLANDASIIGLNLLNANREAMKPGNQQRGPVVLQGPSSDTEL